MTLAALAALALGALGPEFVLSPAVSRGPGGPKSLKPSVCFKDGGQGFAVWEDLRCGTGSCVVGSRIDSSGGMLDPDGVLLSQEGAQPQAGCAATADGFVAVWQSATQDVWATLVRADGGASAPFAVYKAGGEHFDPALATDGQRYLTAWADLTPGNVFRIFAAVLEADGGTSSAGPHAIATAAGSPSAVRIAWSGSEFLVTWLEAAAPAPSLYAVRVGPSGAALGVPVLLAASVAAQDLTFAGSWVVSSQTPSFDLDARYFGPTLSPLAPAQRINAPATSAHSSALAASAGRAWLAWSELSGLARGVELLGPSASGPGSALLPQADIGAVALTPAPQGLMLAAEVPLHVGLTVRLQPLTTALQALDGGGSVESASQHSPDASAIGDVFLVTWIESGPGGSSVKALRVGRDGAPLDPSPLVLWSPTGLDQAHDPTIAALGQEWLVSWFDPEQKVARGRRVSLTGQLLDPAALILTPAAEEVAWPVVASDGHQFLLAWQSGAATMRARLLSDSAQPIGTPATLTSTGQIDPGHLPTGIAGCDAGFVVAWNEFSSVLFSRVSSAGVVLDPGGIKPFTGAANANLAQPGVACVGNRFHVSASESFLVETPLTNGSPDTPGGRWITGSSPTEVVLGARLSPLNGGGLAALALIAVDQPATLRSHRVAVSFASDGGWSTPRALIDDLQQQAFPRVAEGTTSRIYVWARHFAAGNGPRVVARIETLALASQACLNPYDCASGACEGNLCVGGPTDAGTAGAGGGAGGGGGGGAGGGGGGAVGGGGGSAGGGAGSSDYRVGCNCSESGSLGLLGALAFLARWRTRSRERNSNPRHRAERR